MFNPHPTNMFNIKGSLTWVPDGDATHEPKETTITAKLLTCLFSKHNYLMTSVNNYLYIIVFEKLPFICILSENKDM